MLRGGFVLSAGLALLATAGCAERPPPPVCGSPAVLDRLDTMLREAGRPMRLLPEPVGEESTAPGPVVQCAVRGQRLVYDTNRHGIAPLDELFVVHYTLELRHNAIFIALQ